MILWVSALVSEPVTLKKKSEDPAKKARIFLSAEPFKSLEKRAKTRQKTRKTGKPPKNKESERK